jgi:hypothetical protein
MNQSHKRIALLLAGAVVGTGLGFIALTVWDKMTDPFEEEGVRDSVRQIADREDIERERLERSYVRLGSLNTDENLNEDEFAAVIKDLYSGEKILQDNALATLSRMHSTEYAERAVEEIRRVKDHPDPKVRERYIWYLAQTGAESWEQEAQQLLNSPNPEERRLAEKALKHADRFNSRSRAN